MKTPILPLLIFLTVLSSCQPESGSQESPNPNKEASQTQGLAAAEMQEPVFFPSELPYPFSSAVQVGDILYLSGEIGDAGNGTGVVPGGIEAETHQMFKRIQATLAQHGLGLEDVFKCTVMLADMSEWPTFNQVYATYFEKGKYPTRSAMGVNGLALGARVEMEVWAYNPQKKISE
ncbi:RidA family protein [Algoriphagus mannitolivorans]|uniref:RidA family protein n=1 Tax=Algoriphagus mannitolivorans TaxID=226504 RepID=UPI0003FF2D35|nr:RidA family protein [Algoriphagus mannitolivorans]